MRRSRFEPWTSGEPLVENDGHGVKVSASVDPFAFRNEAEMFGRGVAKFPHEDSSPRGDVIAFLTLRNAEVDDFHPLGALLVARDHQVLRADVAVHDAGAMDRLQTVEGLDGQPQRVPWRENAAPADQLREILAVDEFPHHVVGPIRKWE